MTDAAPWWCEAYGPPPDDGMDPAAWPRCFLETDVVERRCAGPVECAATLAAERRRVFDIIQAGAVEGDEVARYLAAEFPTPGTLLGGDEQ